MILENLRQLPAMIRPGDRVLDVGGWHSPLNRANAVVDIMPYATRNRKGALLADVWPDEAFTESSFIQMDICSGPLPFGDKEFDFSVCSHTLEDLRDPIHVCRELVRVSKAGYVEVPSRLVESTKGVERPFYCGYYHHRWLCELENGTLVFQFKPAMLHAYRQFHLVKAPWRKINPRYEAIGFFWKDSFQFAERILIDRADVQQNLRSFKASAATLADKFIPKYSWTLGRV